MLRNDKTIQQIRSKFSNLKSNTNSSNYSNVLDFHNESDDEDKKTEDFGSNISLDLERNWLNKIYYRGQCKLDLNYPEFSETHVLCYQIMKIDDFPVLLFLLFKGDDNELDLLKMSRYLDQNEMVEALKQKSNITDLTYSGHFKTRERTIQFFHVDNYDNMNELTETDYFWVAPCELVNQRRVFHFPINSGLTELFLKYKDFLYIENDKNELIHSPEIGYQNNVAQFQFLFGSLLSKKDDLYQFSYVPTTKTNIGRNLILNVDSFISSDKFGIRDINQQQPLAYLLS